VRIDRARDLHLTYCTNIHPADGWAGVRANLEQFAPALKRRFSPGAPFGIGLRLSARDARQLLAAGVDEFRGWLDREGLYVAIINGFPHGAFHKTVVKADVYAPDWRDPERVRYTVDLVEILTRLVPDGLDGGVSTAPLSYKAWMSGDDGTAWQQVTENVVRVAEVLARTHRETGTLIHLDIEPEPDCTLETSAETIQFFETWLLPYGGPLLAERAGVGIDEAHRLLLEHVRICFDCCHFAVEYEEPLVAIAQLSRAGIQIGRVQLSSAVRVALPGEADAARRTADRLRRFTDPVYLHQVVERRGGALAHFPDLDVALDSRPIASQPVISPDSSEWRVHFHVPLFTGEYEGLGSTQDYVKTVLHAARAQGFTRHLEIETYTWDVLPGGLKIDLLESIAREYDWVLESLKEEPVGPVGPVEPAGPVEKR
jgi:hypothetical protein